MRVGGKSYKILREGKGMREVKRNKLNNTKEGIRRRKTSTTTKKGRDV